MTKNSLRICLSGAALWLAFYESCEEKIKDEEFGEMVDTGYIIDYDGTLADVFVDGFVSNLGLFHNGFKQGKFLVTYDIWKKICDKHDVIVNWANK